MDTNKVKLYGTLGLFLAIFWPVIIGLIKAM